MVKTLKIEKMIQSILLILLVVVTSLSFSGQASAETRGYPRRGEGAGLVSGYTVSGIHYQLAEDPSLIRAVEFDLDGPASQALVSFDAGPKGSFSCFNTGGYHWVCELENVKTEEITKINISAVG